MKEPTVRKCPMVINKTDPLCLEVGHNNGRDRMGKGTCIKLVMALCKCSRK
jgi:hypothetical protein